MVICGILRSATSDFTYQALLWDSQISAVSGIIRKKPKLQIFLNCDLVRSYTCETFEETFFT